jgi:hypothetical protein
MEQALHGEVTGPGAQYGSRRSLFCGFALTPQCRFCRNDRRRRRRRQNETDAGERFQ